MIHPLTGWTVQQHLDHLNSSAFYLAIAGPAAARKTELAQHLCRVAERPAPGELPILSGVPPIRLVRPAAGIRIAPSRGRRCCRPIGPVWSAAAGVVSDFWFEEAWPCLCWLPAEEQEEYVSFGNKRGRRWSGRGWSCCWNCRKQAAWAGGSANVREELLRLATRPGQGPLLRFAGDDLETALPEVLAAMEAMK